MRRFDDVSMLSGPFRCIVSDWSNILDISIYYSDNKCEWRGFYISSFRFLHTVSVSQLSATNDETHYSGNMSEATGRYIEGTIPDWLIRGLGRPWWLVHCQADPSSCSLSIGILADDVSFVQIGCAPFGYPCVPASPLIRLIHRYTTVRLFSCSPSISIKVDRNVIRLASEIHR